MRLRRGFTLVEVLVALVIVAFAVGALMSTLTSAAATVERQREAALAQWIGFNQVSLMRLDLAQPANSTTTGELDYGHAHWAWERTVDDIEIPGIKRITVKVKRTGALGTTGGVGVNAPWVATVTGFKGDALNASSGQSVNWNGTSALSGIPPGPNGNPNPGIVPPTQP